MSNSRWSSVVRGALAALALIICESGSLHSVEAGVVSTFSDDFESGSLSKWNPIGHGYITQDPLNASNHVLSFSGRAAGGDIFSIDQVSAASTYSISFDYLGTRGFNGDIGGGFLGVNGPGETWLYGDPSYPVFIADLFNDGAWHHYHSLFSAAAVGHTVTLKLEDYKLSGPSADNAFFDNIMLADVRPTATPEPGSLTLLGLGLTSLGGMAWLRRRTGFQPVRPAIRST